MKDIGKIIKARRKQLGFTQKDFAIFAKLGYRFVKELEEGKPTVRLDKVAQALDFLGLEINLTPIDYLVSHKNTSDGEIIHQIVDICRNHGVKHLYLYGSYAKGLSKPRSDLDIALKGFNGNISDLIDDIDKIRTLKEIDIVEYDKITNSYLKDDIDKHGKKIY